MNIGIISLLSDSHFEDKVIASLISPELPDLFLEFRAISQVQLMNFLDSRPPDGLRRIILHDEDYLDINTQVVRLQSLIALNLRTIKVTEIRDEVVRALRSFEATVVSKREVVKRENFVLVTGSSSAPGITTVAINLANELSNELPVRLLDCDPRRSDIAFLLGGKRDSASVRLSNQLSISRVEYQDSGLNIADWGAAPDLNTAVSDRRFQSRGFSDALESASTVVFVAQPENNLMFELERFLEACRARIVTSKVIFLINRLGDSTRQRSIYRRCQARVGGGVILSSPLDISALERAKAQYAPLSEVAPRSKLRRSYRELATLLIE